MRIMSLHSLLCASIQILYFTSYISTLYSICNLCIQHQIYFTVSILYFTLSIITVQRTVFNSPATYQFNSIFGLSISRLLLLLFSTSIFSPVLKTAVVYWRLMNSWSNRLINKFVCSKIPLVALPNSFIYALKEPHGKLFRGAFSPTPNHFYKKWRSSRLLVEDGCL